MLTVDAPYLNCYFHPVNFPDVNKTAKTSCGVAEILVKQIELVCKLLYSKYFQITKLYS